MERDGVNTYGGDGGRREGTNIAVFSQSVGQVDAPLCPGPIRWGRVRALWVALRPLEMGDFLYSPETV